MKKINLFQTILSVSSLILAFPFAVLAAGGSPVQPDMFDIILYLTNFSIVALIGIATLVFMYGVVVYVIAKGDEKQLSSGKTYMLYGIIGLTVMVAVWGFVNLIVYTIFGTTDISTATYIPNVPGLGSRPMYSGGGCSGQGTAECAGSIIDKAIDLFK